MAKILRASLFNKTSIRILIISILGVLVYSNTLMAPFEFDDKRSIIENPVIRDSLYFKNPSALQRIDTSKEIKEFFESRYIGYLSFALNYRLHDLNVTGYHIFNILVHIVNALLVYWLVILTFRTSHFRDLPDANSGNLIAFFSALIFAVHPIQTQAVTYIVQRFTSLAVFFYLLSLVFYIKSRIMAIGDQRSAVSSQDNDQKVKHIKFKKWGYYCASIISAVLAMKTKETSFTLPIIVTFYEFMFFGGNFKKRLVYLAPILLTMLIIPITLISVRTSLVYSGRIDESFELLSSPLISHSDYLFTQFRVIVTYIRLIVFPVNQIFDYDYPIYNSFFALPVLSSFLFLMAIISCGIYLLYYSRYSVGAKRYSRLISFGIFWFFITLSVESSIIPRADVIFEHRVYLSSVGFIIAVITFLIGLRNALVGRIQIIERIILSVPITAVLVLSVAAYMRNDVWRSEVSLWKDVVSKSPEKLRGHYNLGAAYAKQGWFDDAIKEFRIILRMKKKDFDTLHYNLGWVYFKKNMLDDAEREYLAAIKLNPNYTDAYINLGAVYINQGRFDDAIEVFKKAIVIKPDDPEAHYNLGGVYEGQGKLENAIEEYKIVLRQRPKLADEHNNIGVELFRKGRLKEAERKYRIAIGLKPNMDQPHYNLGLALKKMGRLDEAIKEFKETIRLKPHMERTYYNLGLIYKEKGLFGKAKESFQAAIKLKPDYHDAIRELEALK